ncbi:MAG: hypothetical protein VX986_05095 [Pseudomonadota bacterium]|nr:hypothetical protein [Pseudomonadota bacterium]
MLRKLHLLKIFLLCLGGVSLAIAQENASEDPTQEKILGSEDSRLKYRGGTSEAERRLESVKQALVDITLGSEIELSSAAYLDDSGVLHESSVMTSNAKIRGIRVLSYVKAAAGITEAELNAEILSDQSCPGSRSTLIREAVVQVSKNYKNHRVGNHYLNEINELLENTVVDQLSSVEGWSVAGFSIEEPYYMRLVSGRPGNHAAYRIEINSRLLPGIQETESGLWSKYVGRAKKRLPARLVEVEIMLTHRDSVAPLWQKSYSLKYPEEEAGYIKTSLPDKFQDELAKAAESLIVEMQEVFKCRVEYFKISKAGSGSVGFVLQAGSFNGVRAGDQFLLSDNSAILDQALSKEGLSGLALGEIDRVDERTATLRQIAGPPLYDLSRYIALPF